MAKRLVLKHWVRANLMPNASRFIRRKLWIDLQFNFGEPVNHDGSLCSNGYLAIDNHDR